MSERKTTELRWVVNENGGWWLQYRVLVEVDDCDGMSSHHYDPDWTYVPVAPSDDNPNHITLHIPSGKSWGIFT